MKNFTTSYTNNMCAEYDVLRYKTEIALLLFISLVLHIENIIKLQQDISI